MIDPQRRSALLAVKLSALVRDHAGEGVVVPGVFPGGAALVREAAGAREAWVLADERPDRALGPSLAWARQQGVDALNLVAEQAAGLLARRAAAFVEPPVVWRTEGRSLSTAEPEPLPEVADVDPDLVALVPLIEAGGAEPVVEHGVLAGEVAGLEVCRAVRDPFTGVARLEVGVGAHDREAFQMIHGDRPPVEALAGVVASVAVHRRDGAAPHPLGVLANERRLRHRLLAAPHLVGAVRLEAAQPPVPRPNVRDAIPCVARGVDGKGVPVVVVCSTGIDLDLVPFAADARLAAGGGRLLLAVPGRDAHPVTRALAARLVDPAEVVPID